MLSAIGQPVTTLTKGEQYQFSGPTGTGPTTQAAAQAFFNQLIPGDVTVVALAASGGTTTIVFDWTGPTTPISSSAFANVTPANGFTFSDLGPTPPAPTTTSSTIVYVSVAAAVAALGALAWYAATRKDRRQ